jgi:hypothetical protein
MTCWSWAERARGHDDENPGVIRWDVMIENARTDGRDGCRDHPAFEIESSTIIFAPGSS